MRAQRTWKVLETNHHARIEQLNLELAAFNKRIAELEKLHAETQSTELLRATAITLARQIDEVRCSLATEKLAGLLAK
jgi:uncharacterized protein YydD (DUF2326 family)